VTNGMGVVFAFFSIHNYSGPRTLIRSRIWPIIQKVWGPLVYCIVVQVVDVNALQHYHKSSPMNFKDISFDKSTGVVMKGFTANICKCEKLFKKATWYANWVIR